MKCAIHLIAVLVLTVMLACSSMASAFAAPNPSGLTPSGLTTTPFCLEYSVASEEGQVKVLSPAPDTMGVSIRFSDFGYNPGRGEIAAVGPCSQPDPSLLTCKLQGVGYGKYLAASLIPIDSPVTLTLITTGEKGEEDSDGKLTIDDFWEPDASAYLYKSDCQ